MQLQQWSAHWGTIWKLRLFCQLLRASYLSAQHHARPPQSQFCTTHLSSVTLPCTRLVDPLFLQPTAESPAWGQLLWIDLLPFLRLNGLHKALLFLSWIWNHLFLVNLLFVDYWAQLGWICKFLLLWFWCCVCFSPKCMTHFLLNLMYIWLFPACFPFGHLGLVLGGHLTSVCLSFSCYFLVPRKSEDSYLNNVWVYTRSKSLGLVSSGQHRNSTLWSM